MHIFCIWGKVSTIFFFEVLLLKFSCTFRNTCFLFFPTPSPSLSLKVLYDRYVFKLCTKRDFCLKNFIGSHEVIFERQGCFKTYLANYYLKI